MAYENWSNNTTIPNIAAYDCALRIAQTYDMGHAVMKPDKVNI
jgi:hypothetical protein